MSNWETCKAVERYSDKVGGVWLFTGTRVPLAALFENLKDGASTEQFLNWFPGVERWKVEAVLYHEPHLVQRARSLKRMAWTQSRLHGGKWRSVPGG